MADNYNKYIKYKTKYLELKNKQIGGGLFAENEKLLFDSNINKISKKIMKIENKRGLINFINNRLDKKYTNDNFATIKDITKILSSLTTIDLIFIDSAEHFDVFDSARKKPDTNKKDIDTYIDDKKLELSYSINDNGKIINNLGNNIYAMHSIGKVFTGFLIMLLLNDGIITKKDINSPLQLDKDITEQLPKTIKKRLKETTMLDVMTHQSGLTDYLGNYFESLRNNNKENPINPEDFVQYIDHDVKQKNKFNYSNSGLLLCGLSAKHLYNKRTKNNKSYNEILNEYIIKPADLRTFSITKPKNAIFNDKAVDVAEFINGSPTGGYWISVDDLAKFGAFILEKPKIKKYLEKYGGEFYHENMVSHSGGINGSNCWLTVYLDYNISVAIMDNNGTDSRQLKMAIEYFG